MIIQYKRLVDETMTTNIFDVKLKQFDRKAFKNCFNTVEWNVFGKVSNIIGTIVEAVMPSIKLGTQVRIIIDKDNFIPAEVVGFKEDKVLLLPFSNLKGIAPGCKIEIYRVLDTIKVGDFLLGNIIDPFINSLTSNKITFSIPCDEVPLDRPPPNPVERQRINEPLSVGVRAIDGLLTLANGQRIGIMAGSGVGKSVLMGMIAQSSEADVNVIGLIGERGREVKEFIDKDLGKEGLKKSVVVVVTSDQSPLMKIRGAKVVIAIAEYFSSKGKKVMLMMDSLTRVAMAQREIGLAIGEPPTTKGYTPSVFSLLPKLLERSGSQKQGFGAITALYTVLVDADDFSEPIADTARSILDGHINLTRKLAYKGHFPAIDISSSISRLMVDVVKKEHYEIAMRIKELIGIYEENLDLIQIGAYQIGTNSKLDQAIKLMPAIESFLKQDKKDKSNLNLAIEHMKSIFQDNISLNMDSDSHINYAA